MDFANAMKQENKFTRTENGAVALNTTSDARLDLFGTIGALREANENRITTLFSEAFAQDKLLPQRLLFMQEIFVVGLEREKLSEPLSATWLNIIQKHSDRILI